MQPLVDLLSIVIPGIDAATESPIYPGRFKRQSEIPSSEMIQAMHRVHHLIDPDRGESGISWRVEISGGQHIVYHGAGLPEQTSFMLLDLTAHIGVLVLTNAWR